MKFEDIIHQDINSSIASIKADGIAKLHIVADFDRTLTMANLRGSKYASIFGQIRNSDHLGQDYKDAADALFNKYRPIEIDPSLSVEQKSEAMHNWWVEHFDLVVEKGLTKQILESVIQESKIQFRPKCLEILELLHQHNIPLIIMSAGLTFAIEHLLEKHNSYFDNIHVISNELEFDDSGRMIRATEPIIHSMNKHETKSENQSYYNQIKDKPNVILLGDSIGDLGMIEGFSHDQLIKIGFLNEVSDASIKQYQQNYDVVLLNDAPMDYILDLLESIF